MALNEEVIGEGGGGTLGLSAQLDLHQSQTYQLKNISIL